MKKKLLLIAAFVTALFGANAQESLTFDGYEDQYGEDNNYAVEDNIEKGIFTIVASSSASMRINNNEQRFANGKVYTARLQTTGGTSSNGRYIIVKPESAGTLSIAARTGASSEPRDIAVTVDGREIFRQTLDEDNKTSETIDGEEVSVYPVYEVAIPSEGDIQIIWEKSLYIYGFEFEEGDVDPIDPPTDPGDDTVIEWTFDTEEYLIRGVESGTTVDAGTYTGLHGMTIFAVDDDKVKVELTKSIKDGSPSEIATKGALNTGGKGNGFSIANVKAGDVITLAMGGSGAIDEDASRGLEISENDGEVLETLLCEGPVESQTPEDFVYTVKEDGTVTFTTISNGVVVYNIILSSDGTGNGGGTSIADTTSELEVIATTYYNVSGIQFNAPQKGLNIIKETYEDGSVKVSKAYIK